MNKLLIVKKIPITMRITCLLLCLIVFQLQAEDVYSQKTKISLDMKNTTIEKVLQTIEEKSDYHFLYNNKLVNVDRKVSVRVKDATIADILDRLFESENVEYQVEGNQIILSPREKKMVSSEKSVQQQPQQREITGKVTDASGQPLPGATVVVKGTTIGTVTDADGNFSLRIPSDAQNLQISFVGMKTEEIPIAGQTVFNVILEEEAIGLDEVVAIGYGFTKKVNLTGSVASIDHNVIEKVPPVASTANMLAGRLPGLISKQTSGFPGGDAANLSVRGFGPPLVIVDGVEREFNNVDVNEIESISILKDASSAIYGARAGNGVILITTKRGSEGKPTISVNSSYSFQTITNYPKTLNSVQFVEYDREKRMHMGAQQRFTEEDLAKYLEGTDPDYISTDWYDVLIRSFAPLQQHNLSIRGGSDKIKYFGLVGFMEQETFWGKNGGSYSRYNIRSNTDAKITDNLSLGIDFSNINEFRKFPARGEGDQWHDFWCSYPIYPPSLPDPTKLPYTGPGGLGGAIHSTNRETVGYNDNDSQTINIGGTLLYDFPFVKGLSAKLFLNYFQNYSNGKGFNKPYSFYTYSCKDDRYTLVGTWSPEASLSETRSKNKNITNQFSLNYDNVISKNHSISALAVYETIDYKNDYITAARYHFLTPAIDYLFAGSTRDQYANGSASEMGRKSFIGRLSYSFANKYYFEGILRADASAKFPKEKRWGYFPCLSLGWRISEESFMKHNIPWLENLKLRGGVGNSGYDNVGNFAYLAGYRLDKNYIFNNQIMSGITPTGLPNPDLTWEKMTVYNLGLDFSILHSLLYSEFDIFYRKREGIPATRLQSLPTTFGASLPPENLNSSNDRGFEVMLGTRGGKGKLSYDMSANISWSRAKWDHYEEPDYADPDQVRIYKVSGQWMDRLVGYKTMGLYTSQAEIDAMTFDQDGLGNATIKPGDIKYIDVSKDGKLDWRDQVDLGVGSMPHLMFGFSIDLQYNGLYLNMLLQGAGGNQVPLLDPGNTRFQGEAELISQEMFKNRWSEDNNDPHATYHRIGSLAQGGGFSDFYLRKAGYIRLKTLNFGYNFPKKLLGDIKVENLRIFFGGTNLFTLDRLKKYGYDPEIPLDQNAWCHYPQQRVFSFGINLEF